MFVLGSTFSDCSLLAPVCLEIYALSLWCGSICITLCPQGSPHPHSPHWPHICLCHFFLVTHFQQVPLLTPASSWSLKQSWRSPWDSRTHTSSLWGFYSFENRHPQALFSGHHSSPWNSTQPPSCLGKVRPMCILISNTIHAWCAKWHGQS